MSSLPITDLLRQIADRGWRLSHSPPPYADELPLPGPPRRPRAYSLLILDLESQGDTALRQLRDTIGHLRREFAMPVFGRPGEGTPDLDQLKLRDRLVTAGGHFLPCFDSIHRRAHEVLTIRPTLASDWLQWYRLHREIRPRQEEAIRALVNETTAPTLADRILEKATLNPRSARRWLADASLPPPGCWARASRLLRALLHLQRDANLHVYDVAIATGYSSIEAFSNGLFRYFGHGALKGRGLLGLEGRFAAFHERAARSPIVSGQDDRSRC